MKNVIKIKLKDKPTIVNGLTSSLPFYDDLDPRLMSEEQRKKLSELFESLKPKNLQEKETCFSKFFRKGTRGANGAEKE